MKIGALIGFIVTLIGSVLRFLLYRLVVTTNAWDALRYQTSIEGIKIMIFLFNVLFLVGIIVVLASGFVKSTPFMIVGTIFYLLATLAELGLWFAGQMAEIPLVFLNGFYVLASLLYFLGLISFRKHNKITIITGAILFLVTVAIQGAMGIFAYIQFYNDDSFIQQYFIALSIEGFLWTLHAFLFSLSKKKVGWKHEDADDELSVESGGAFASYVPTENKVKNKKKSKKDDEFTFDF